MKKIIIIVLILSAGFSCTKYIEDQNIDPTGLLSDAVESKYMIKGVMNGTQYFLTGPAARISMMWMNQATGADRQYIGINDWNNTFASSFDNAWGSAYVNSMFHATETARKALDEGNNHIAAVAMILKAHTLGTAASLWGDIPYSEAFDHLAFPNPSYDSQESVFIATQQLLDEAIVLLENPGTPVPNDIFFDGDIDKWIKAAHGLKAKFYLHVKDYSKANDHALLGPSSANDDYRSNFEESLNNFYNFQSGGRAGYMTATNAYAVSLLHDASDLYRGHPNHTVEKQRFLYNYDGAPVDLATLGIGGWSKFKHDGRMPFVTYGEMLLIQTEYQARTNGLSDGLAAYNTYRALLNTGYATHNDYTIVASFFIKYLDYAESDFDSGGMENEDGKAPIDAFMRELYEERYVYFIGCYESLTDYTRTNNLGEIILKPSYQGSPQRFLYSQTEINSNSSTPSPIPDVTVPTPINQ